MLGRGVPGPVTKDKGNTPLAVLSNRQRRFQVLKQYDEHRIERSISHYEPEGLRFGTTENRTRQPRAVGAQTRVDLSPYVRGLRIKLKFSGFGVWDSVKGRIRGPRREPLTRLIVGRIFRFWVQCPARRLARATSLTLVGEI